MRLLLPLLALIPAAAVAQRGTPLPPSTPMLGTAEGRCRAGEAGPAFIVYVEGIKDRRGRFKLELYPANDQDFLAADNKLIAAGKVFRRIEVATPAGGPIQLCIRAPAPGAYALIVLHDRDANRKFGLSSDGIGFPGNPRLRPAKPKAATARAIVGSSPTPLTIRMNYRRGLFSFGPLER